MQNKKKRNVLIGALAVLLVAFVHFPLIPAAPFLEYDPADVHAYQLLYGRQS